MPTLVQFGAGNIGRGFIAPTFTAAGWRVLFVDVSEPVIEALARRGRYRVTEVDERGERVVEVAPVDALHSADSEAVAAAVAECDLAATAVGLGALSAIGPGLARGLLRRLARGRPLDVLVCENGAQAPEQLRAAVLAALPPAARPGGSALLGVVRAAIGRMVPVATGGDVLDLRVEPYARLPVDRAGFRTPPPQVANLEPVAAFDLVLGQKLYLHNLTHACLAYAGHLRGHPTIPACMADAPLVEAAHAAGEEAALALARAHAHDSLAQDAIHADCRGQLAGLFARYRNAALDDPVARVARDPLRKLAADDRLVGAARLCLAQGVAPEAIAHHLVLACRYTPAADEPGAARWLALRASGMVAQLTAAAGLDGWPAAERAALLAAVAAAAGRQATRGEPGHG